MINILIGYVICSLLLFGVFAYKYYKIVSKQKNPCPDDEKPSPEEILKREKEAREYRLKVIRDITKHLISYTFVIILGTAILFCLFGFVEITNPTVALFLGQVINILNALILSSVVYDYFGNKGAGKSSNKPENKNENE